MNICYVYLHKTLEGIIFYIGKGSNRRAKSKKGRSLRWKQIAKNGYTIEIIKSKLSDEEAFELEYSLIAKHRDTLVNSERESKLGTKLGSNKGKSKAGYKHLCQDCNNRLKNIYAQRCQNCRTAYKKTDEYKVIHSAGQKRRFQNLEERKKCATRIGISPVNKGITGNKLSLEHKENISKGLRRHYARTNFKP